MKKQFVTLTGFSALLILNNGTVIEKATGKEIKPNAKGVVKLTATEDVTSNGADDPGYVAGKPYSFKISDIISAVPAEQWQDMPETGDIAGSAQAQPLTDEQKAEEERKEQLKTLRAAINKAKDGVINATPETFVERKAEFDAATKALADFEEANKPKLSEADQKVMDEFNEAHTAYNEFAAELKALKDILMPRYEAAKKIDSKVKISAGSHDSVPNRAPSLNYEKAQAIRKDVSEGMSRPDAAKKYGVTSATIGFVCSYTNWKLKEGDRAYLPVPGATATATNEATPTTQA